MKTTATSATHHHNHDHTTIPFPSPRPAPLEQTVQPAPDAVEAPTGGPRRGRPSGYSEKVIDMLRATIRQYGLSDSAAAERHGMSTTTLSRWKKQHPEIGPRLKEAREGCRIHYLDIVMRHAEADDARGFRAATWILERLFPRDYSPRMKERFEHVIFEEQRERNEERAVLYEDIEIAKAESKARHEEARKLWEEVQAAEAAVVEEKQQAAAAELDSHNSENSGGAASPGEAAPSEDGRLEHPTIFAEHDSHNSRKPTSPGVLEPCNECAPI